MDIKAIQGSILNLYCIVQDSFGSLVEQPVGFPKVHIEIIESGAVVEILPDTVMSTIRDGEYFYQWLVPDTVLGRAKVKFSAVRGASLIHGFDFVDIHPIGLNTEGLDEFKTFIYNPDSTVNNVTIKYGNKISPISEFKMTFVYDTEGRVQDIDVEKQ